MTLKDDENIILIKDDIDPILQFHTKKYKFKNFLIEIIKDMKGQVSTQYTVENRAFPELEISRLNDETPLFQINNLISSNPEKIEKLIDELNDAKIVFDFVQNYKE